MTKTGLDTNILLRAILDDDPKHSPVAQAFLRSLNRQKTGYICIAILMEFFWVLRTRYKLPKKEILSIIGELGQSSGIEIEQLEIVLRVLVKCEDRNADFSDVLIGELNIANGCETTMTFDERAATRLDSMELLT